MLVSLGADEVVEMTEIWNDRSRVLRGAVRLA